MEFQALRLAARVEGIRPCTIRRNLRHRSTLDAHHPEISRGIEGRAFEEFPSFGKDLNGAGTTEVLQGGLRVGQTGKRYPARQQHQERHAAYDHAVSSQAMHRSSSFACSNHGYSSPGLRAPTS